MKKNERRTRVPGIPNDVVMKRARAIVRRKRQLRDAAATAFAEVNPDFIRAAKAVKKAREKCLSKAADYVLHMIRRGDSMRTAIAQVSRARWEYDEARATWIIRAEAVVHTLQAEGLADAKQLSNVAVSLARLKSTTPRSRR